MNRTVGKILLALVLSALPAAAQQARYAVPGALSERRVDVHDAIMELRKNARWQVGFLDVEPQLALTDLGYVSNVFSSGAGDSQSDLRATGLVGLRGFFNLGPKVVVSPFANLKYSWWQDQTELRESNESFGIQLFGDFNRLKFNLQAGQVESQSNLSSELEVPVNQRNDRIAFGLDIDFWGPFRMLAGGETAEKRYSGAAAEQNVPGLVLADLDVDIERVHAGIGYEFPSGLDIAVGVERAETTYLQDPDGRSNEGTGPMVQVRFEGSRLFVDLKAAWRDLEFAARQGADRQEINGFGQIEWRLTQKLATGFYGGAQLEASALDSEAVFDSRREGVFLQHRANERSTTRLFFETGTDEFATVVNDDITRSDDLETYGLSVSFDLTPRLSIDLGFFDSRRESTDPGFNRDFSSVQTVIRLGGDLLPW